MKKCFYIISAAALALASCSEEQELVNAPASQENRVLTVAFEQEGATRTNITSGENKSNILAWSTGDEIAVFGETAVKYTISNVETGTFQVANGATAPTEITGVAFPHSANASLSGNTLTMTLPSEIDQTKVGELDLPMWATVSDGDITLKHLAGVLKVNLTDVPENYNTLTVTADKPISGTFTATVNGEGDPVLTSASEENSKTVTVNFTAATTEANDYTLYLPLPVADESNKYGSIVVSVTDGTNTKVLKQWTDKTVERAKVYSTSADISTYVTTANELETAVAAENNATIVNLGANISMSDILTINKAITIDGNGFTLTSTASRAINIETEGSVTIKNIKVEANGERAFNVINKPAKLTLESVTATAKNYAVMVATTAGENATSAENAAILTVNNSNLTGLNVVNIAGAYTQVAITNTNLTCNDQSVNESYGAISIYSTGNNVKVAVYGGKITVNGNSYAVYSFANNVSIGLSKTTYDGTSEYKEATEIGSCYITYANQTAYGFKSLEDALEYAKGGETIYLAKSITVSADTEIPANITLDGNNFSVSTNTEAGATGKGKGVFKLAGGTIKNISFTSENTQYDIIVTAGGSTIENCKFETASNVTNADGTTTYGKRAIYGVTSEDLTGTLTVKNCTFDDKVYAFNFSGSKNNMDISFSDCTLGGWLSGTGASHTFTNCTFKKSGEYANYIPYCPARFNNCSFEDGFAISLKKGSTYTFSSCKYNNETVTTPDDLKWDFSGGTTGTGDNGTDEKVIIEGQDDHYWTNSVGESTGEEATPNWVRSGNQGYIPV